MLNYRFQLQIQGGFCRKEMTSIWFYLTDRHFQMAHMFKVEILYVGMEYRLCYRYVIALHNSTL